MASMKDSAQCAECEAILEDLRAAQEEIDSSPALRQEVDAVKESVRVACESVNWKTVYDAVRNQLTPDGEVGVSFQLRPEFPSVTYQSALRRLWAHETDTGHRPLTGPIAL